MNINELQYPIISLARARSFTLGSTIPTKIDTEIGTVYSLIISFNAVGQTLSLYDSTNAIASTLNSTKIRPNGGATSGGTVQLYYKAETNTLWCVGSGSVSLDISIMPVVNA